MKAKTITQTLNLGLMQSEVELATRNMKSCWSKLQNANDAYQAAEERYNQANKALLAGVATLRAATKLNL